MITVKFRRKVKRWPLIEKKSGEIQKPTTPIRIRNTERASNKDGERRYNLSIVVWRPADRCRHVPHPKLVPMRIMPPYPYRKTSLADELQVDSTRAT